MGVKGNLRIMFWLGGGAGGALQSHMLSPTAVGIHVDPSHDQKDPKNDDDPETGAKRELGPQTRNSYQQASPAESRNLLRELTA